MAGSFAFQTEMAILSAAGITYSKSVRIGVPEGS